MTASMGLPDLGIITIEEVAFFIRQVARAIGLPRTGRWRHRIRRSAQCHEHGAHLRGCRRRGPFIWKTSCFRKNAGHLNDKKLADAATWPPRSPPRAQGARRHLYHDRENRCRGERRHGGRGGAGAKRYLEAGADAIFPEAIDNRARCSRSSPGAFPAFRCWRI